MEGLNTNDLLCCRFCSVSGLILNAWKILAFCGRILGQLCINFGKSDGCVIDKCCLRHCHRGTYCYLESANIAGSMRYLTQDSDVVLRTNESHDKDVKILNKTPLTRHSHGVKGKSELSELHDFDQVWGCTFDNTHTWYLGFTKSLFEVLYLPTNKYLTKKDKKKIDQRLRSTFVTRELQVKCLPMSESFANMKAKHWKNLLLFYGLPVLCDFVENISEDLSQSFATFVNAAFKLSEGKISIIDLEEIETDLALALAMFEDLFGRTFITCNIHLSLHVVDCVRKCGPLWCTSTIAYESYIGNLQKYVNGSKGVEHQIAVKHLQMFEAKGSKTKKKLITAKFQNFSVDCLQKKELKAMKTIKTEIPSLVIYSSLQTAKRHSKNASVICRYLLIVLMDAAKHLKIVILKSKKTYLLKYSILLNLTRNAIVMSD